MRHTLLERATMPLHLSHVSSPFAHRPCRIPPITLLRLPPAVLKTSPPAEPRYSWGNRPDFNVLDEPLYGHYLRVTGAPRPYREEVRTMQAPKSRSRNEKD